MKRCLGAHRSTGKHRLLDLQPIEHRTQILGEQFVGVCVGGKRGAGMAVPARVVGDRATAGALQRLGAHHDIVPGRGEAMQQHDRRAAPRLLHRESHVAGAGDGQLL